MAKAKKVQIREGVLVEMIKDIVGAADYDLGKQLDPETAECGEEAADEFLDELVQSAKKYVEVI